MRTIETSRHGRFAVALLSAAALLSGCHVVGWFSQAAFPVTQSALYEPKQVKTLVLVDDPKQLLPTPQLKAQIAARIGEDLVRNEALDRDLLIDPARITEARIEHPDFNHWYVEDIANHVGADQVIHLQVTDFHLGKLDDRYRPAATVRIKVWLISERKRVFPDLDAEIDYVTRAVRLRSIDPNFQTRTRQIALRQSLAAAIADKSSKLFYEHEQGEFGTGVTFEE